LKHRLNGKSSSVRAVLTIACALAMVSGTLSFSPNIAAAIDPCEVQVTKAGAAATSDAVEISSYSIYCVAKFKTVANDYLFTVPAGIAKIDYLVVGGGGGGASGGGGAGGVLMANDYGVTSGSAIAVTVGAGGVGGAGGRSYSSQATKGSNSVFGSITALGGGHGGAENVTGTGANGASGGGSRFDCTDGGCGSGVAGSSAAGQGNNGGYSTYNSYGAGGGGGGAGGAGFNTTRNYIGGNGGIGITSDITGTSTYYGGGGGGGINSNDNQYVGLDGSSQLIYSPTTELTNGGGQGGLGGGGRGSSWGQTGGVAGAMANATAGEPNTGGGGGGTDPEDINAAAGGSGVVILRWVSNVNLKTITFNSNEPSSTTATQRVGSGVSTPLSLNSFSRTGYVFMGWTTAPDGTGTVYADGDSYTTSADVTLYAKWAAGVTKTITFDNNGGSGSMSPQVAGTSVPINPNEFSRTNYTFSGWKTAANTGFYYGDGSIYSFQEDTTLYAQWQPVVPTYRVTFYGNAADGGTTATQSASTTTPLNLNGFTRTGYNFLGWNTNYSSGSATYLDGQNYVFTSDLNLYAIWVAQTNNNLVFDGNGSTSGSTAGQTASNSTMLRPNGFTRTNYTFRNWNTSADGTGASYQSNYVYSFAAGLTLYAQWGANYTVSFDFNTSDSGTTPSAQNSYVGSPGVNLPLNTGNLKKNGYRLAGWNENQAGTGAPYALGASSVKFTTDKVLYAQWAPAVYSVIYAANGAAAGVEPSPVTFAYGTTLTVARNTGQLEKPGYTFSGWSTAPDGTGTVFEPETPNVALTNDTVLFAKWVSIASVPTSGNTNTVPSPSPSPSPSPTADASAFPKTIIISGFAGGSANMTSSMRSKIKMFLAKNPGFSQVKITGYTEGPTILKADKRLAQSRAVTARNYMISKLNFKSAKILLSAITYKTKSSDLRRIKITLAK
jgi:uncharacterized repeat protein (TIGR02543 family)